MPWITKLNNDGNVAQSWELGKEPVIVGRGDGIGIYIDDDQLSRKHFEIKFVNDNHILTDLNSTNGTRVNGRKVMHSYLKSNDLIHAGETTLQYQVGTSTMLGFVEKTAGTTFKNELKKIYDGKDPRKS